MAKMKKIEALCLQELSLKQLKMWLEEDQDAILNKVKLLIGCLCISPI